MAISYVGGQVAGRVGTVGTTSVTFALTGGSNTTPQPGDLVVITSVVGSQGRTPAQAISGYTALGQLNANGTTYDTSLNVSWKVMGLTPDLSFTLPSTGDAADAQRYTVQVWRGVDTAGITSASATGTGTGRPNAPSITPTVAGSVVVLCGGGAAATGASYTAPTNFTTNFLTGATADTNDAMVGSGYWTGWTSGAVDPAAYTGGTTNAVDSWAIYSIVLPPASVPARTAPPYRDSLSGGDSTFTTSSVSVPAPTVAVGDLEVIRAASAFLAPTTAPILATPAGWERLGYGASTASAGGLVNTRAHVFYRISPDTGSAATLDAGATAVFVYTRTSYSDPDPTYPIRQGVFGGTAAATSLAASSLDVLDDSLIELFASLGAAQTVTAPGSMTVRENDGTYGVSSSEEVITSPGATGTRTLTWPSSSESVWAMLELVGAAASGDQSVTVPLTTRTRTVYAPTVTRGAVTVSPPLVTRTRTVYAPTVSAVSTISPPLTTRTRTVYAPTVTPGAVSISPPLVSRARTVYAPTVTQPGGGDQNVTVPLVTRTRTVYVPTVTRGAVTLSPPLVTRAKVVYAPTVTRGAVTISPPLVSRTRVVYAPTLTSSITISPPLTTRTRAVYAPTVTRGAVTIQPPLVIRTRSVYPPVVYPDGGPPPSSAGLAVYLRRRRR